MEFDLKIHKQFKIDRVYYTMIKNVVLKNYGT